MIPPAITKRLEPCQALEGEEARFECTYSSPVEQRPSVSWYRENELIRPSTITSNFYSIVTSENKSSLTVKRATMSTSGLFTVKVENSVGSATSSANLLVIDRASNSPSVRTHSPSNYSQMLLPNSSCAGHQLTSFTTSSRSSSALGGAGSDLESCSSVAPTSTHDLTVKLGDSTRVDAHTRAIGLTPGGDEIRTHSAMSGGGDERVHNIHIEGGDYTLLILDCSGCQHPQSGCSCQCQQQQQQLMLPSTHNMTTTTTNTASSINNMRSPSPLAITANTSSAQSYQQQRKQQQPHQQQPKQEQHQQQKHFQQQTQSNTTNTNMNTNTNNTTTTNTTTNSSSTSEKSWQQLQLEQRQFEQQQSLKQYQEREEQERRKQQQRQQWQQEQRIKYQQQQQQQPQEQQKRRTNQQQQPQNYDQPWLQRRIPDNESVQSDPLYRDLMLELQKLEDGVSVAPPEEPLIEPESSQKPVFGQRITPERIEVKEYEDVEFVCRLIPIYDPTMQVEWRLNGKVLEQSSRITSEHEFGIVRLRIKRCEAEDSGIYQCKATNALGEAISTGSLLVHAKSNVQCETLHPAGLDKIRQLENPKPVERVEEQIVEQPPKFLTHITDYVEKCEGESVHFECCLTPVDDAELKTEWFFNGRPLVTGSRFHTIDDFGFIVLDIDWLFPRDTGEYVCRATNKYGTDITRTVLRVKPDKNIVLDSQLDNPTIIDKLRQLEFPDVAEEESNEEPDKPAHFIQHLRTKNGRQQFIEGDNVHFEARVGPATDGNLTIEWFHNDKPLISGHRFKPSFDFGYIVLDILYVYADDSGVYKCVARNSAGTDVSQFEINVTGKPSLVYQSQLPKEMVGGVQKITDMEAMWNKAPEPEEDEAPMPRHAPQFVLKPKPCVAFEGSCARFCCRIVGNPKPRLTWVLNGQTIVSGSRYKLTYDGMYHLTIAKCLLADAGRLEVYARNLLGECFATTELKVRRKVDDYRGVLKNSPKPWYDEQSLKVYQRHRSSQDTTDDDDDDMSSMYDFQQQHHQQQKQHQLQLLATQQQTLSPLGSNNNDQLIGYMDADAPDVRLLAQRYSPLMEQGDLHPVVVEQQVIMAPAPSTIQRALKVKDSFSSADKSSLQLPVGARSRQQQSETTNNNNNNTVSSYQDLSQEQQQAHVFGLDLPRYSKPGTSTADSTSRSKSPRNEQRKKQQQQQQQQVNQEQYQEWLQRQQLEQQRLNRISASEERMLFGNNNNNNSNSAGGQWSRQQSPAPFFDPRLPPPSPESVVHGKEVHSHTHKQRQLERRANKEILREIIEKETFEQEHKGVTKDNLVRGSSLDRQSTPDSVRSMTVSLSSRDNFNQAPIYNPHQQQQQQHHRQVHFQDQQQHELLLEQDEQESEILLDDNMTPPEFVQKIQPCQALDGHQAQFECTFIGDPKPTISWFRETKLIKPSNLYSIKTDDHKSTLTIRRASLHANAVYTVKAENAAGSAKSSANLVVDPHPSAASPVSRLVDTVRVGTGGTGGASTSSTSSSTNKDGLVTYTTNSESSSQLADNNLMLGAGHENDSHKIVKSVKTRRLRAEEVSELIRASPEGTLAPTFLHTIHDLSAKVGELARLDARLVGSQPMEVRWLKDGQRVRPDRVHKMVLEGDLYTLLILECSLNDQGCYQCTASNRIGEATCEANLSVLSQQQQASSSPVSPDHQRPLSAGGSRTPDRNIGKQQSSSTMSTSNSATTTSNNRNNQRQQQQQQLLVQQQREGSVSPSGGAQRQHFGVPRHQYSPLMNQYTSLSGGPDSGHQQEMPKLIKGLENQQVYEGKSVTLRCQISSFPIPEVHWFKHGDKPIKPSKYFRIFKDNDETYCLKILETFAEDQGEYKCVARSPNGQMNVETKATVTVIPNSPNKV